TATQDAVDAGAGPRRPQALGSAPSLPRLPRGARVEMNGSRASQRNIKLSIGPNLAVPQGTRDNPQPSEAACHHTASARPELVGRRAYLVALVVSSVARSAA